MFSMKPAALLECYKEYIEPGHLIRQLLQGYLERKKRKKKLNRNMSHVINLAALPNSSSLIP